MSFGDGFTDASLYEWDEDIPDFETVHAEAEKARAFREGAGAAAAAGAAAVQGR